MVQPAVCRGAGEGSDRAAIDCHGKEGTANGYYQYQPCLYRFSVMYLSSGVWSGWSSITHLAHTASENRYSHPARCANWLGCIGRDAGRKKLEHVHRTNCGSTGASR